MLKKSERLDRESFSGVYNKGKRFHSLYVTSIFLPENTFSCSVVVSKKVSKKSPVRNTFRRKVYSIIEDLKNSKKFSGQYIFIIKPEVTKLTKKAFSTLVKDEVGRVLN